MTDNKEIYVEHALLDLPLFHVKYNIVLTNSTQHGFELLSKVYGIPEHIWPDGNITGYSVLAESSTNTEVIMLINTDIEEGTPGLGRRVSHESVHTAWYILDSLGIKLNVDNHEIQAYLVEEIIDATYKLMDAIDEFKNSNNENNDENIDDL